MIDGLDSARRGCEVEGVVCIGGMSSNGRKLWVKSKRSCLH